MSGDRNGRRRDGSQKTDKTTWPGWAGLDCDRLLRNDRENASPARNVRRFQDIFSKRPPVTSISLYRRQRSERFVCLSTTTPTYGTSPVYELRQISIRPLVTRNDALPRLSAFSCSTPCTPGEASDWTTQLP